MLRITVRPSDDGGTIKLAGSLAGPSVRALGQLWRRIRAVHLHHGTRLDVSALASIDSEGKILLRRMRQDGAHLLPSGPAAELLEDFVLSAE
jgi:hypothetical protein